MNAIVLAGDKRRKSSDNEGDKPQLENKALINIKDKHMIEYVIDALKGCTEIQKIAVVGPVDKLDPIIKDKVDYIIEGTDSIVDNIILALDCFPGDKEVLISTSDIPMITVEAIEDFIMQAKQKRADLCYSVVDKQVNDERFPGIRRTYARLREGQFTGGNIFLFNPAATDRCKTFIEKMLEYRKSPAKMAKVLGVGFLIKLVLGMLTIKAVQDKCEKLLGIKGAVVISRYPELGNDIDKPEDVDYILKFM